MTTERAPASSASPATEAKATVEPTRRPTPAWRATLWAAAACALALSVAYFATYRSMVETWKRSETFAHGFVVVPIVAWLVWRKVGELMRVAPSPALWGLPLVGVLSLAWLGGWAANVLAVQQLAAVFLIPAVILTLAGPAAVRTLAFPLAFLLFAVPVGEFIVPLLTDYTARVTVAGLQLVGVPVSQEGLYFRVPGGHWEISKACSGIRYLMATVAVGALFAHLNFRTRKRRLQFLALSVVVPIVANWIRAFLIVMTGYLSDMKLATGVDHIIYGWIFFSFITLGLCWFGARWREPDAAPEPVPFSASDPGTSSPFRRGALWAAVALALVLLTAPPAWAQHVDRMTESLLPRPAAIAPMALSPWRGPFTTEDTWQPVFADPDDQTRKVYRHGTDAVHYFAAYYGKQRQGAELINSVNRVYDRKTWRRISETERSVPLGGRTLRVIETSLYLESVYGPQRRIVWHWYFVGGNPTTNPYLAKFLDARSKVQGTAGGSAVVAVASDYETRPEAAREVLKDFLGTHLFSIERGLRKVARGTAQ
jgi:exosortase A